MDSVIPAALSVCSVFDVSSVSDVSSVFDVSSVSDASSVSNVSSVYPSQQAVGYICERFLDWALPECEHGQLMENIRKWKVSRHRPMHR